LLAEVENARLAIAVRDPDAASNDVAQALSFANQLPDRPSKLMRSERASSDRDRTSEPNATRLSHAPLTDFGAQVELNSAQVELTGNLEAADAHLRNIQNRIPQGLIPRDLPLLRAAASLELARFDASAGQTASLRTQLLSAQSALRSYTGPGHVAEAKALAATIDQALSKRTLDTMLTYQPSSWLTQVVEWAGTDRWSAPIR
jgi:hypothetical protein